MSDKLKQLKYYVGLQLQRGCSFSGGEKSIMGGVRADNLRYYLRDPAIAPSKPGQSSVITSEVSEAIETMMPNLHKVFSSSEKAVAFEARDIEDEDIAKVQTEYINYLFYNRNDGFSFTDSYLRDGLIYRNGFCKIVWEEAEKEEIEAYADLDELQLQSFVGKDGYELVEQEEFEKTLPNGDLGIFYNIKLKKSGQDKGVKIYNIPPEEFIINETATSIEDATFIAHKCQKTVSDVIEEWDITDENVITELKRAATSEDISDTDEELARDNLNAANQAEVDDSIKMLEVSECYLRFDFDGDERAEYRRVVTIGNDDKVTEIIHNEETDYCPFETWTPIPIAHKFYGLSVVDLVKEVQQKKTALERQILNNMYLINNGGAIINPTKLDPKHFTVSVPNQTIMTRNGTSLEAGDYIPMQRGQLAPQTFDMLNYFDVQKEERSGASKAGGLSADALNNVTAKAASIVENAAMLRTELIARYFAESLKGIFKKMLYLCKNHKKDTDYIKIAGENVEINTANWDIDVDITARVGLGTGNKDEQLMHLQNILLMQKEAVPFGLASMGQVYNTLARIIEVSGLQSPESYFTEPPKDQQLPAQQQQQPDPSMLLMQQAQQIEQMKAENDQLNTQIKKYDAENKYQLGLAKLEAQREKDLMQHEIAEKKLIAEHNARINDQQVKAMMQPPQVDYAAI